MLKKVVVLALFAGQMIGCEGNPAAPAFDYPVWPESLQIAGQVISQGDVQLEGMTVRLEVNDPALWLMDNKEPEDTATVDATGRFTLEYRSCRFSFIVFVDGNGFRGTSGWLDCTESDVHKVEVTVTVFE